jgi:hypothetical protein
MADEKSLVLHTGAKREAIAAKLMGVKNLLRRSVEKGEKQPLLF